MPRIVYFFYDNLFHRIVQLGEQQTGEPGWGPPCLTSVTPGKNAGIASEHIPRQLHCNASKFIKRYVAWTKTKLKTITVPQQFISKSRIMSSSSWMSKLIIGLQAARRPWLVSLRHKRLLIPPPALWAECRMRYCWSHLSLWFETRTREDVVCSAGDTGSVVCVALVLLAVRNVMNELIL
jgi:hypothetical protein